MRKGGGKGKGNGFERKVMKQITKAFKSFGVTDTDAFRSILSGGHKESFSDISVSPALAKFYPYATECKFYKKVDLYHLLDPWGKMGKANLFKSWWKQAVEGANKSNGSLMPLLVFKSNSREVFCMVYSHHFYPAVGRENDVLRKRKIASIRTTDGIGDLLCFRFEVLLKLLVSKQKRKKRLNNGRSLCSEEGDRVRLRSQTAKSHKQVP